jgi:hypothetical protein
MKRQEDGENCIMRSFIALLFSIILHKTLIKSAITYACSAWKLAADT